jgi:hypothetical protein
MVEAGAINLGWGSVVFSDETEYLATYVPDSEDDPWS